MVKSRIGKLSDDGDWWIDQYSGQPICPKESSAEEGYEQGFKISSRAVMEADAGNKIMSSVSEKSIKYDTPDTIMINNVITALSIAMGVNIENQKEFIINGVLTALRDTLSLKKSTKKRFENLLKKGRK